MLGFLQRLFQKPSHAVVPRPIAPTELLDHEVGEFVVMVSSPFKTFEDDRQAVWDILRQFPGIKLLMFDRHARSGLSNIGTSLDYVDQCDLFVALFGDYPGTARADYSGKTYSQLEVERARTLHSDKRRPCHPRILICRQRSRSPQPPLHQWQIDAEQDHAAKTYANVTELLMLLLVEVGAAAFAERRSQAQALLVELRKTLWSLAANQNQTVRLEDLCASREKEIESIIRERQRAEERLANHHGEVVKQLTRSTASLERQHENQVKSAEARAERLRLQYEDDARKIEARAEGLSRQLTAREMSRVRLVIGGACVGAVLATLASVPLLIKGLDESNLVREAMERVTGGMDEMTRAVSGGSRQVTRAIEDGLPFSAAQHVATKIRFAQSLFPDFHCDDPRPQWSSEPLSAADQTSSLALYRDNICYAPGALEAVVVSAGGKPCEQDLLGPELARWLAGRFQQSGFRVARMTIVGHASHEEVGNCGAVPSVVRARFKSRGLVLGMGEDLLIETNVQLGLVRAAIAAATLENAFEEYHLFETEPQIESIGTHNPVYAAGRPTSSDENRRVVLEMTLIPTLTGRGSAASTQALQPAVSSSHPG
jgi:hypothetical protein